MTALKITVAIILAANAGAAGFLVAATVPAWRVTAVCGTGSAFFFALACYLLRGAL